MTEGPLDVRALRNAIVALSDALDLIGDTAWFDSQPPKLRNTLIAGTIQSVEFVYELSVKTLHRAMERRAASPAEIDFRGFRDMVRTAAQMGFIEIEDVTDWFDYREMRNITSHTYDEQKARVVLAAAPAFLAGARQLMGRIEAANV